MTISSDNKNSNKDNKNKQNSKTNINNNQDHKILTKKEQFFNLIEILPNEEFYILKEEKNPPYTIYHFNNDLILYARSSNDKEGIFSWCASTSLGKLLDEDVKLIKIK